MLSRLLVAVVLTSADAAELTYPNVLHAADSPHDLSLQATDFLDWGFQTRAWNGGVPGPTFRMKPGQTLKINLFNKLNPADSKKCTDTASEFCESEVTNLHTHGLHVSAKGKADNLPSESDDIFVSVKPGENTTYEFKIPEFHAPGMHWYHPHHHHATTIQAGGGAAGVMIVDDPEGYLPKEYANMPDKIMVVSYHDLALLQEIALSSQTKILADAADKAALNSKPASVYLVNGQWKPELTIEGGKWTRLRMVFAAVELNWQMEVDVGPAACQLQLLAKDGIYLSTMPRPVQHIPLYPGARADVAIRCTCPTYPCKMPSAVEGSDFNVFTYNIVAPTGAEDPATLPTFSPAKPCYLADLQSANVPVANQGVLNLDGGGFIVSYNGVGQSMTYANTHAGGKTQRQFPPIGELKTGNVYEMTVGGAAQHPLHVHVNPYQITWILTSYHRGYFQRGDWHDTLMLPSAILGPIKIRTQIDTFTGKQVVHCHILEHEDEGMMGFFQVAGTEDEAYKCAESLDTKCYRTAFNASVTYNHPVDQTCLGAGSTMPGIYYLLFIGGPIGLLALCGCCGFGFVKYRANQAAEGGGDPEAEEVELTEQAA